MEDKTQELKKDYFVLKKSTIYKILIAILSIYLLFVSTFTMIKVLNIEDKISTLNISNNNESVAETLDITTKDYYSNYLATDDNFDNMINGVDTYILYFHQDNCQYCMEANVFIDRYIELGYMNYVPVIFVNPDSANEIFDKYDIEGTPTAIYHVDGKDTIYDGADEIWTLFDELVASVSSAEDTNN